MPTFHSTLCGCVVSTLVALGCAGAAQQQPTAVAVAAAAAPAEADSSKAARAFFDNYVALSERFDPAAADLYSDSARIRARRGSPSGELRDLELTGKQWKELLVQALPTAKARGDISTFSDVSVSEQTGGVRVAARRYSTLKCRWDEAYFMVVAADAQGLLQIVEEYSEGALQSDCGVGEGKPLAQRTQEVADQVSPILPVQVDAETRLDKVTHGRTELAYNYTLNAGDVDPETLRRLLEPQLEQRSCSDGGLSAIISAGGSVIYDYADAQGKSITRVVVKACP